MAHHNKVSVHIWFLHDHHNRRVHSLQWTCSIPGCLPLELCDRELFGTHKKELLSHPCLQQWGSLTIPGQACIAASEPSPTGPRLFPTPQRWHLQLPPQTLLVWFAGSRPPLCRNLRILLDFCCTSIGCWHGSLHGCTLMALLQFLFLENRVNICASPVMWFQFPWPVILLCYPCVASSEEELTITFKVLGGVVLRNAWLHVCLTLSSRLQLVHLATFATPLAVATTMNLQWLGSFHVVFHHQCQWCSWSFFACHFFWQIALSLSTIHGILFACICWWW